MGKKFKTFDFLLSKTTIWVAATSFVAGSKLYGLSHKTIADKSCAKTRGIKTVNKVSNKYGCPIPINLTKCKLLKNIVEQDHKFKKRQTRQKLGINSNTLASATLAGIKIIHMARKGQFTPELRQFQQIAIQHRVIDPVVKLARPCQIFPTEPVSTALI